MFHVLRSQDQKHGAIAKVAFEGAPYGAGISFFQGDVPPGKGPRLHQHPYSETCIVLAGQAAMVVGSEELMAGAGDVVVIGPGMPHRFTAVGDAPAELLCVHASERFIIEWCGE